MAKLPFNQVFRRVRGLLGGAKVRRTPTILQMEAVECGAAALAMILAHHGAWIPLEQLRVACGVSRDGVSAGNIVKAARLFGLDAKGLRTEPASLPKLPMPCIIHWNFNHFVVLEGIDRGRAFINDPAMGRRRIDMAELDLAFTGVVLVLQPTPEFRRMGAKPQGLRLLLRELGGSHGAVALLALLSVALVVPGILIPAFSKIFVDNVLIENTNSWLIPLFIGMGVTTVFRAAVTALQQSLLLRLQIKLAVVMISRFLWHVLALPMEFFTQRHAGDIANRVDINEQIARLLSSGVASNALNLTSVVFFAAVMALYDLPLAAIAVGMSLINVLALQLIARRREDLSRSLALERGKLVGSTVGAVRTIETLKASGLEDEAFGHWAGIQAKNLNAEQDLGASSVFLDMFPTLLSGLTMAAILGIGGLRVIEGALTLGGLVAFQSLTASFSESDHGAGQSDRQHSDDQRRARAPGGRLQLSAERSAQDASPAEQFPPKLVGRIEVKNLHFGYSILDPPLAERHIDHHRAGHAGRARRRLGERKVDARPADLRSLQAVGRGNSHRRPDRRRRFPPQVFANSVAYVDQDIFLFEGTARDNLTLWDATVSEPELSQALQDAAIHDDIATRPGNYDCYVAEGRDEFQRRPASTHRDRARARLQSVGARARRGDRRARSDHRKGNRRQSAATRLHLHHHRAPPEHDPRLRRDHRAAAGRDRRARERMSN